MISPDGNLGGSFRGQHPLQFQYAFARHDDLLRGFGLDRKGRFTQRQPMPVGGNGAQHRPVDLQQHAVQVIAHVLLCHRKMRFLEQTQQLLARNLHRLLRVDIVDDRKFRRRQVDRLKRLRPALITTFSPSTVIATATFSGSARRISRNFRPGTVMSPASCTVTSVAATNSTSRSVAVMRQLPLPYTQQHICQYRHGLASFDHADDRLQGRQ